MHDPNFTLPEDTWALCPADHRRTIIHLDVDCFYAQVEMVRDPSLRDKPLGVKQKNLMVTSNYVARSRGVKKSMWIKDALDILPDLVLVDGSDLTHYRQFSSEISSIAQTFTSAVERLGLDENFVDVTEIVSDYMDESTSGNVDGHIFGDKEPSDALQGDLCGCGCRERLVAGSLVAKKLRQQIFETTGITCCAGIAHNKLLAKLVCGYYKPNQQTVLFPWQVSQVMGSLKLAKSIPGIGSTTSKILEELGICTVMDLQNSSLSLLHSKFDDETCNRLRNLSFGKDETLVKKSGRPQSIGLEDAFRKVNSIVEVRMKYCTLVERLLKLLKEDGRIPTTLRVTVRKFDHVKKFGNRESRQAPILPSLFATGVQNTGETTRASLMEQVMGLFHKMVDTSKEYHLTLIGIGFTKFTERATQENSISRFFFKRKISEAEDQDMNEGRSKTQVHESCPVSPSISDTCTQNLKDISDICSPMPDICANKDTINKTMNIEVASRSLDNISERKATTTEENLNKDTHYEKPSTSEEAGGSSDCDVEDNRCHLDGSLCDTSANKDFSDCTVQNPDKTSPGKETNTEALHGIDHEVFDALPTEIQEEIRQTFKRRPPDSNTKAKKIKVSQKTVSKRKRPRITLDDFFSRNDVDTMAATSEVREPVYNEITKSTSTEKTASHTQLTNNSGKESHPEGNNDVRISDSASGISALAEKREASTKQINNSGSVTQPEGKDDKGDSDRSNNSDLDSLQPPKGVDPSVFNALPPEIQREIVEERKHSTLHSRGAHVSSQSLRSVRGRGASSSSSASIMKYLKRM